MKILKFTDCDSSNIEFSPLENRGVKIFAFDDSDNESVCVVIDREETIALVEFLQKLTEMK
jgi:hypothetical protein